MARAQYDGPSRFAPAQAAMALLTAAGRAFLLMWGEAAAADSPLRDIFAERDTWFCNVLRSYVADGVREGSVRADADPAAAAAAIMSQLRGIGLELMINPDAPPADAVRRETVIMVRRACRPEAPAAPAGRPYWG